jgi:hypothetical protein
MAKAIEIRKVARGRYIHPDRVDLTENGASLYPGKNGKNGKKQRKPQ